MGEKCETTAWRVFYLVFRTVMWINVAFVVWSGAEFVAAKLANPESWCYSEMLINYRGGFVRRGLLGQLFYTVSLHTGISPTWIILPLCLCAFVFVVAYTLLQMHRRGIQWWLAVTPLMFGTSYECIIRKDFIILSLLIAMLCIYRARSISSWCRILLVTILCVLSLLIYEPAFFMFMPVLGCIMWRDHSLKVPAWGKVLCFAVIIVVMGLLTLAIGSAEKAAAIQMSWHSLMPDTISAIPATSIEAISWNIHDSLAYNNSILLRPLSLTTLWIAVLILLAYYVYTHYVYVATRPGATPLLPGGTWSVLIAAQTVSLTPLWLGLTCDYGRMCMYVITTSLAIATTLPAPTLTAAAPGVLQRAMTRVDCAIDRVIPPTRYMLYSVLMLAGVPFANHLPGAIKEAMPLKRALSLVTKLLGLV